MGLCPFHPDRNPSMTVNSETGRYKCWSCGAGGDVFTWVMERRRVDFPEALEILAREAGITLTKRNPEEAAKRKSNADAMEEALKFFREQLTRSTAARDYCERRGLDHETREMWELGYAPDVSEALATHLKKAGFNLAECRDLFLVEADASGGYYDKFRGRLMFPIRDERGTLVAFGGRLLGQGNAKYINSGDTPLFRKSKVLYGFNKARPKIAELGVSVLVEGYLDVIACFRAGVTNAVASLGTALTEEHAMMLKKWSSQAIVLYDSDAAGQKAVLRALEIFEAQSLRARVAIMADGEDPDSLLGKRGPAAVQEAVARNVSPLEFRLLSMEKRLKPAEPEFWAEAVNLLSASSDDLELERHLIRLAPQYPDLKDPAAAQKALRRMVERARPSGKVPAGLNVMPPRFGGRTETKTHSTSLHAAEVVLFRALLEKEFRRQAWVFARNPDLMSTPAGERLARAVGAAFPVGEPVGEPTLWLSRIGTAEDQDLLASLTLDLRGGEVTVEVLTDSVAKLRNLAATRQRTRKQEVAKTEDEKQAILLALRRQNPDLREKAKDVEDRFD